MERLLLDGRRSATSMLLLLVIVAVSVIGSEAFVTCSRPRRQRQTTAGGGGGNPPAAPISSSGFFFPTTNHQLGSTSSPGSSTTTSTPPPQPARGGEWDGNVVSTNEGRIQGCTVEKKGDTEFILTIDGVEADLGKFSLAVYKKIITDAKQQRFQGFRPGTIPAHLDATYRAFCMDECARETVLEAMQQNNIRPFESCRTDMELYDFSIPPEEPKKKKTSGRKKNKGAEVAAPGEEQQQEKEEAAPQWRSFATMKAAIDAGWKPGQSFTFRAIKVRGQQLKPDPRGRTMDPITGKIA